MEVTLIAQYGPKTSPVDVESIFKHVPVYDISGKIENLTHAILNKGYCINQFYVIPE